VLGEEPNIASNDESTILCVVGGGQDGFELAETFAKTPMPNGKRGVVITGPFMPKDLQLTLHQLAKQNGRIEIIDRLVETDDYMRSASRVVAMGGYNTVTSILSFGKPSLIVPRMVPRQEQWIRAQRLANLGMITAVQPQSLNSQRLSAWLRSDCVPTPTSNCIDLCGLNRISQRVGQWVNQLGCSLV
jgi:predicted glycosyltransferase